MPIPIGVIGELYIGGAGLAQGYLNQPALTAERFVPNRFATESDTLKGYTRLYKTGDLVRWSPEGHLEYIGRVDFQVKIRGYRIELGEIEHVLSAYDGVKQSIVLAKEKSKEQGGHSYLAAYYVSNELIDEALLRDFLSTRLPDYMIPAVFVRMDVFPLTINGKLDRKALPTPDFNLDEQSYLAPRTELEVSICTIWQAVLGVERVGIKDDFFRLGGHSILAIQVSHQMSQLIGKHIAVADIFKYKTIAGLEAVLIAAVRSIEIKPIADSMAPLSFAQERLWFIEQYEQGTNAYHIPLAFELNSTIKTGCIKKALQAIVSRHEILRTVFKQDAEGIDYQQVEDKALIIIEEQLSQVELAVKLNSAVNTVFDLRKDNPIKVWFFHVIDDNRTLLVINIHHIAFDGWSTNIFMQELTQFYSYYAEATPIQMKPLVIQYKDFAVWQRAYLAGEQFEKQVNYWQTKLTDCEPLVLPTDAVRPSSIDYRGDDHCFELSSSTSLKLKSLAQSKGVTLYTVLLSGFYILLSKYTGQSDLVIGTPLANRHYEQLEAIIGFFVNSLAIRVNLQSKSTVEQLIEQVHQTLVEAQLHQDLPFEKLVERLKLEPDLSRHPLFQVMFGLHRFDLSAEMKTLFKPVALDEHYKIAKFDLSVLIDDSQAALKGHINYATSLYKRETIERFAAHYQHLLEQIADNSAKQIKEYSVLSGAEYQQIVYDWNMTDKAYPHDKNIHQLFEEQVLRTPDNIAVIFEGQELTYQALNEQSNQLARHLRAQYKMQQDGQSLQADTLIALCLERSFEMIIAILGVLKAGGAYVPIDPTYPDDRIRYLLQDTSSSLLLTQKHLVERLDALVEEQKVRLLVLDDKPYQHEKKTDLSIFSKSTDLAYVIYTSGTTGLPKGTVVTHKSLTNLVSIQRERLNIDGTSIILQYALLIFDASVWEIFSALALGAKLSIISTHDRKDPQGVINHLLRHKITIATLPPALLMSLEYRAFPKLQILEVGGEICHQDIMVRWSQGRRFINAYGPTESTVCTTMKEYQQGDLNTNIGKPMPNMKVYVLDHHEMPVPIGVIGELYIGGAGLAQGYLNQPALTAERFAPNRFATESDIVKGYTRLYKTGDLVRWLPEGHLEYIGRVDFQVKIRGHRIELGEIEHVLSAYDGVKQSIVLAKEKSKEQGGHSYLAAYYVSDELIDEALLRDFLSTRLPDYMIPAVFVHMDVFPLTINGKLDKKALPTPDFNLDEQSYLAPRTALEVSMCAIWQAVLGVERVGIKDDFFRLGGDSILSIQLTSKLRHQGILCDIKDLFEQRTIECLAHHLSRQLERTKVDAEQGVLEGCFDLLPIQSWFFEQNFQKANHWNQAFVIQVPSLSVKKLEELLLELSKHHDILRVTYIKSATGLMAQRYQAEIDINKINTLDIAGLSKQVISETLTFWQSQFDIEQGPLWQVGYLHGYQDGSVRLHFAFHHLIVDAVSWRILVEDLKRLYDGQRLGEKGSSYRQWVNTIQDYAKDNQDEVDYWKAQVEGQDNDSHLHKINSKPHYEHFTLDKKATKQLIGQVGEAYHTEINDLLLTALAYALEACLGNSSPVITLEGHGRERLNDTVDVSHTLGWFTTIYPVKLGVQDSLSASIQYNKENLRQIPNKGIGYSALKYRKIKDNQALVLPELPLISFNYLGQFDAHECDSWQFVSDSAGITMHPENVDHHLITVNAMLMHGELGVGLMTRLDLKTSQKLSEIYQTKLVEIINHCMEKINHAQLTYTPSDFNSVSISQNLLDKLQGQYEIDAIYPANSLQQGFIYHALSQPKDDAYRVQTLFDYHNKINISCYQEAWKLAIKTYPSLRTCFNWEENLIQITVKTGRLRFTEHDISDKADKDNAIIEIQERDRAEAFDLTQPTLLRLHLIKHNHAHYTLIKSEHHSISDGWSGPLLLNTVHNYYYQLIQGTTPQVTEDRAYLRVQAYIATYQIEAVAYWQTVVNQLDQANDLNALLTHPTDLDKFKTIAEPKEAKFQLDGVEYQALKSLVKQEGLTLNVLVQFAWHKLIQVYTGDSQTIVGTTISGRNMPVSGIEESVGLYINTLPLIVEWKETTSVRSQLQSLHQQISSLNNHSFVNLSSLQHDGKRLFHSLLIFENYPVPKESQGSEHQVYISLRAAVEKLDYSLVLFAHESENKLHITLKYDGKYVSEMKAQQLLEQFRLITSQLLLKIGESQQTINLLTPATYHQIVYDWNANATVKAHLSNQTIQQWFEKQVASSPDNIAVIFEDQELTYQALNEQSNQLARHIRTQYKIQQDGQSLPADTLIALCLERSLEMIIAILGVLKAGGAYVPIDPTYPDDRIQYILKDTNAAVVLTQTDFVTRLETIASKSENNIKARLITLDDRPFDNEDKKNLSILSKITDLAYVIYTSGTTGKPKGVMIEQRSFLEVVTSIQEKYFFHKKRISTYSITHFVFDIFGLEYGLPLLTGGCMTIGSNEFSCLDCSSYDFIQMTPSLYDVKLDVLKNTESSIFLVGGEPLTHHLLLRLLNKTEQVINVYGPTETTIWSTSRLYNQQDVETGVSLGKPFANETMYVLDIAKQPVPIGAVGELYIGGEGLARGYLNNTELTLKQFIENPFQTGEERNEGRNGRIYKTGDLVRWLPDGQLEYVGRNDFQVKIRGHRIELEEIERVLARCDGIKQCIVLAKDHLIIGNQYLAAYYVSDIAIDESRLRLYLSDILPDYMIPNVFVFMVSLPLTINGKLDKKALPIPDFYDDNVCYVAPKTESELMMCNIWQGILGVDRVGIKDDFFRLGGNSILVIQVVSKMNQLLNKRLTIADVFRYKNISNIVEKFTTTTESFSLIKQLNTKNNLLPVMYFVHPGSAGCEVYQMLADLLQNDYQSIGIDNYNIYCDPKIDSLSDLAKFYIKKIEQTFPFSKEVNLLGWSLGGQIALDIAYELEQKGFKKINVYLLDTVLGDVYLKKLRSSLDRNDVQDRLKSYLLRQHFDAEYIEKICQAHVAESAIMNNPISGQLIYTKVLLFKAAEINDEFNTEHYLNIEKYICSVSDNNVQKIARIKIRIEKLNCHHSNILERATDIVNVLIRENKKRVLLLGKSCSYS